MPVQSRVWNGTTWKGIGGVSDITPLDPFTLGTTKPDATNTGRYAPTTTTVTAAETSYTVAGATIRDTLFLGNINVAAANITFENCEFRGRPSNTANHIVRVNNAAQSGAVFNRCTFVNDYHPSDTGLNGAHGAIMGHRYTLNRCDLSYGCDGAAGATASTSTLLQDITIQGCYIHDLWYTSPGGPGNDGNHCDGFQAHKRASNLTFIGNTIEGIVLDTIDHSEAQYPPVYNGSGTLTSGNPWYDDYPSWVGVYDYPLWATSAIGLFCPTTDPGLTNITIDRNWLDGGGLAVINLDPDHTSSNSSNIVITNNRMGRRNRDGYFLIRKSTLASVITLSGNVYENTGQAIPAAALTRNG